MTFAAEYDDWARIDPKGMPSGCSTNLVALLMEMREKWPGTASLGCFGRRPVRGGTKPSTHSWGAAIDIRPNVTRESMLGEVIPYLVGWSAEWHIQRINDYVGCRIWTAGRTASTDDACDAWWKAQRRHDGFGEAWATYLHVETTVAGWYDGRSGAERGCF